MSNARIRIGVSTYSFWHFRGEKVPIEHCIDQAAEMGFDGVEVLHQQMSGEDNPYLQLLKRRAFTAGLDLHALSIHQGFVSPEPAIRQKNIDHTIHCIELAYAMGIPCIRINTGRWGTIQSFDDLMAAGGQEPALAGYSDNDAFGWVISSIEQCLPHATKCGVVLGLENHWGIGRTAEGVLRIVDAIHSPWLKVTMDTGNFLERMYEQLEMLAPQAALVHAKTYIGGGEWYTLQIDYARGADSPARRLSRLPVRRDGRQAGCVYGAARESGDSEEGFFKRRTMRNTIAITFVSVCLLGGTSLLLAADQPDNTPPEGFVAVFNGKDLTGWKGLVGDPPLRAR